MSTPFRPYNHARDFMRVRQLLVETHSVFGRAQNWGIERWNYSRYFVIPMIGRDTGKEPDVADSVTAIRFWEDHTAIWENERGDVVAALTLEYPWLGDVFFQRHPDYDHLLPALLDHAETHLVNREKKSLQIHIYDCDAPLLELARQRGYQQHIDWGEDDSEYVIGDIPAPNLPDGFVVKSMTDERDLERRREIFGRSFNHTDPAEWPTVFAYEELQRAPDYRPDLDLYVVAPDGRYVSCCIVWYDERNRQGILEPVGTHPDFRRQGLAREVVLEGIRRAAALGAQTVAVGSGQEFYLALGFQKKSIAYTWTKTF